jgi:hypothetical protein
VAATCRNTIFGDRQGCGYVPDSQYRQCEASIQNARDFIWNHWTDQRRGYLIITMGSDDAQSDAHIFIEPGDDGRWRVAWTWKRIFGFPKSVAGQIDAVPDIHCVERREETDLDVGCLRGGVLHLSLIDDDGQEVFCL